VVDRTGRVPEVQCGDILSVDVLIRCRFPRQRLNGWKPESDFWDGPVLCHAGGDAGGACALTYTVCVGYAKWIPWLSNTRQMSRLIPC